MIDSTKSSTLISTPSFEDRSVAGAGAFLEAGGSPDRAFMARLGGDDSFSRANREKLESMGFSHPDSLDRLSAAALWSWAWRSVSRSGNDVVVDSSTIPRELLAMILFALSVRRSELNRVRVLYTSPSMYTTQAEHAQDRWLSRGIRRLRTIIGYPGSFSADRNRHVVALAGHEDDRLLEIISFLEPTKLSIGNEHGTSSTVPSAQAISAKVNERLRERIGLPQCGDVLFFANSIEKTCASLSEMLQSSREENVAIVAMNTKLSFIGAALCALSLRHVRMVYAVPVEYNPHYSAGVGGTLELDVTELIKATQTIQAPPSQA